VCCTIFLLLLLLTSRGDIYDLGFAADAGEEDEVDEESQASTVKRRHGKHSSSYRASAPPPQITTGKRTTHTRGQRQRGGE
jgi:hypothetical protein